MHMSYANFLLVDNHSCHFCCEAVVPWLGLGFSDAGFPRLPPSPFPKWGSAICSESFKPWLVSSQLQPIKLTD